MPSQAGGHPSGDHTPSCQARINETADANRRVGGGRPLETEPHWPEGLDGCVRLRLADGRPSKRKVDAGTLHEGPVIESEPVLDQPPLKDITMTTLAIITAPVATTGIARRLRRS